MKGYAASLLKPELKAVLSGQQPTAKTVQSSISTAAEKPTKTGAAKFLKPELQAVINYKPVQPDFMTGLSKQLAVTELTDKANKVQRDLSNPRVQFAMAGLQQPTQNDINNLYRQRDNLEVQYDPNTDQPLLGDYTDKINAIDKQISELAKIVPNAQLRSGTPAIDSPWLALAKTAKGMTTFFAKNPMFSAADESALKVAEAIMGRHIDNPKDFVLNDMQSEIDWAANRVAANKESMGTGYDIYDMLSQGVAAALPQAALAIATGGTSAVEALPALGGNAGLGTAITSGLSKMVQSPLFVSSFAQTYGSSYDQAIASGASEEQAQLTATLVGLINSGIELTGGIETLPSALQSKNVSAIREWVSSALDEGKEEVVQGVIERLTNKMVYDPSAPIYSNTDPNAVFNPSTAAQEFGGGVAVGGILGGGQIATQSAINSIAQSQGGKPQNPELNANSNTTASAVTAQERVPATVGAPSVQTPAQPNNAARANVERQSATLAPQNKIVTPFDSEQHIDNRTYESVGNRKVNAFQFDNPVVHKYYADMARLLLIDLKETTRGQRIAIKDSEGYIIDFTGVKRDTTAEIARLLDNADLSYAKIEKALNDIIADHGQENYAAAKKVELVLDDMLSNGYTDLTGVYSEPNAEYLALKDGIPEGEFSMSEEDWNSLMATMPEGMGAASDAVDDLGAAKGGLYQTNQWAAPDKYAVNKDRNPDLDNLPTEKAQVVLESPKNQKTLKDRWNSFYKHVVDNQHGASRFDKVAGSNVSMWMSNARSANGIVNNALNGELRDFDGNRLGDSLHSVLSHIPKAEMKDFFTYAYHSHNINRAVMGNNIFTDFNKEQSAQKVKEAESQHPEWKQYRDDIVNWIATFSKAWSVDTGLVSEDIYNNNRVMYPNYIPSHRIFEEIEKAMTGGSIGDKFVDVSSQMHKATGSDRNMNPLVNIANLVHKTINAAAYNKAGQEIYKAIEANPDKVAEFGEIVSEGSSLNNVVSVLIDGQRKYMKLYDADLLEALNGLPKATKALPFVSKLTAAFKGLITQYNILFGIKNLMRDIPTGYAYGSEGNPFKYLKGEAKALKEIITNGEMYRLYKSVGGGMSNYVNKSALEKFAYGLAKQQSGVKAAAGKVAGGIEAYNAAIETMTRLNEFMTVYNKTGDPHAALDASNNVTVNFARGGDITKTLDKNGVAYLNAGVQGLDKFVRSFSSPRAAVTTLARAGLSVTLPTLVLYLINMANPHYEDEDDRNKDAYYLIPNCTGPIDEYGYPETFIRIPKGREFGALFGALFERILRWSGGENADSAFKGIGTTISTNFAPNNPITNNIFAPATWNIKANKDFAGRTIVPQSLQKLSPHLQYDEKTSELSKFISDMAYKTVGAEWSPKVMDYLIDSYTGIVGDILLPATTKGGDPLSPFSRAFVTDSVYNNQTLTNFYDNMDKAARVAADKNLLNNIPSEEVTREEKISNMYSKANTQISTLSKISARAGVGALTQDDTDALKALGIDTTLKAAELQREIKKAQIDIAKSAIARAENGSDMELDMYNNSNIKNTVDKYAKAGLSQTQAYELYNSFKELQPLPGKENVSDLQKYELIVNSKLNQSDTLKALSVAMGDTKTYSNMMIAVKAGLSPKRFIQIYSATNNMKSDKDADGKDIKGQTKQDKVWDYINKLGVSIDQKNALHYAMGYAESSLKNAPWNKK